MRKSVLLSVLSIVVMTLGCATIIDGKSQRMNLIPSSGGKMSVQVVSSSGMQDVNVPNVVQVDRSRSDIVINIKEDSCYDESRQVVKHTLNPISFLNLFNSGLGFITDYMTGALWEYDDVVSVYSRQKAACRK